MDRGTLHAVLRALGVRDGHYYIEGVHEPSPLPTDFLYLRRSRAAPDMWETGAYERGTWETVTRHAREESACAHLLRLLTGTGNPSSDGSAP
ncbi:hypothetical protein [Streptomyces sp. MAR25Y5]|uniref:hypothetical protein n=1 Tax=Streptomyces sp. MAR25Y5 TaxID=2962028 RepID=UPI0020B811E1|nr:hypothetical protein [Streptomyces sp. MAR25Y5]MCP3767676.1 hypothetical protein [Streptomyces sp. MAR25Y5]